MKCNDGYLLLILFCAIVFGLFEAINQPTVRPLRVAWMTFCGGVLAAALIMLAVAIS